MTKKDIAIIGGTFDPVHNGHTAIASFLSDNYIVDEIWMLPSYNPPFKDINHIADFNHRVNMLNIAIKNIKRCSVNTFEENYYYEQLKNQELNYAINPSNKTYTYDVLKAIQNKFSNSRLHFICGFDSMKSIFKWHNYKELLNDYWFYIFDRNDNEFRTIEQKKYYLDNLGKKEGINFYYEFFTEKIPDVSSTKIKENIRNMNNEVIFKSIDINVYDYIIEHNLYL